MRYLLFVPLLTMLFGCADALHRYGPDPFGKSSQYNVEYISSNATDIYSCLVKNTSAAGYKMETGFPEEDNDSAYFVTKDKKEVARFNIEPQFRESTGIKVSVFTSNNSNANLFSNIIKACKSELEPSTSSFGMEILEALIKKYKS